MGIAVLMRENSILFGEMALKASDIVIQTPFGTRAGGSPVRRADAGPPGGGEPAHPKPDAVGAT